MKTLDAASAPWLASPELAAFAAMAAPSRVLVVGGSVRDALLGRTDSDDLDVVTDADRDLLREACIDADWRWTDHPFRNDTAFANPPRGFGTGLHVGVTFLPDLYSSLPSDAAGRDFTCNAVYAASDGSLIDPVGGAADIAAGRLVPVASDSFSRDPVRLIREPRMRRRLGAGPHACRLAAMREAAPLLADCPRIRVMRELYALLDAAEPEEAAEAVADLASSGALGIVFPGCPADALTLWNSVSPFAFFESGNVRIAAMGAVLAGDGSAFDDRVASYPGGGDGIVRRYATMCVPAPDAVHVNRYLAKSFADYGAARTGRGDWLRVDPAELGRFAEDFFGT